MIFQIGTYMICRINRVAVIPLHHWESPFPPLNWKIHSTPPQKKLKIYPLPPTNSKGSKGHTFQRKDLKMKIEWAPLKYNCVIFKKNLFEHPFLRNYCPRGEFKLEILKSPSLSLVLCAMASFFLARIYGFFNVWKVNFSMCS